MKRHTWQVWTEFPTKWNPNNSVWVCSVCGHVFTIAKPPEFCPECAETAFDKPLLTGSKQKCLTYYHRHGGAKCGLHLGYEV